MNPDLPPPPSPEWPALSTAELVGRKPGPDEFAELPRTPISVVLEDVRSLANVGLIFRSCDALRGGRLGVTPSALREADVCVEVPVFGMANSLNVAMACALVGYEIVRQHEGFGLASL